MAELNAEQELEFIKKVMTDSSQVFDENGLWEIVWSGLTTIGILIEYAKYLFKFDINPNLSWAFLMIIGWAWSIYYGLIERHKLRHSTFAKRMLREIWTACGIGFAVLGFIGSIHVNYQLLPALFCLIAAIGTYLTARITGRRGILGNAVAWWLASILMLLFPGRYNFLIMALLMIMLVLIPGLIRYYQWRRITSQRDL